jgi:hypothetical protein
MNRPAAMGQPLTMISHVSICALSILAINYLLHSVTLPNPQREPDDGKKRCYRWEPTSQGGDSAADCHRIHHCFCFLLHHLFFALPKLIASALTTEEDISPQTHRLSPSVIQRSFPFD